MSTIEQILDKNSYNNLSYNELEALKKQVINEISTVESYFSVYQEAIALTISNEEKKRNKNALLILLFTFISLSSFSLLLLPHSYLLPLSFSSKIFFISICLVAFFLISVSVSVIYFSIYKISNPKLKYLQDKNLINPLYSTFEYVALKKDHKNLDNDIINIQLVTALVLKNQQIKLFKKFI